MTVVRAEGFIDRLPKGYDTLVFENGAIVEEGRHGDLRQRGGLYARLAAMTEGTA